MLWSITLNNASGTPVTLHDENSTTQIHDALGFTGIGSIRESRRPLPSAHGGLDESKYEDGRLMVVEGAVWSTASMADAWAKWDVISAALMETLDVGPALIKWQRSDGVALQRLVKVAGEVDSPVDDSGAAELRYQAQFYAEDPRAYSQTESTVSSSTLATASGGKVYPRIYPRTFNQSSGGIATFTNAGTRPTPIKFRIYGQALNPQIVLLDGTNRRIVLNGTVQTGDYLELDVAKRSVMLNGTDSRRNFLDSANTTWVEAPKGNSTWQLIAASFDASALLQVIGRSAYV